MIRVVNVEDTSLVNGEGIRFTIFMSGCSHECDGCHNPESWDYNNGFDYDIGVIFDMIEDNINFITGITLSGGDPLYQLNDTKEFLQAFRQEEKFKDLSVWLYTGYKFEQIPKGITQYIDVIIDGKYEKDLPPIAWRGSNNQKLWRRIPNTNKFEEDTSTRSIIL